MHLHVRLEKLSQIELHITCRYRGRSAGCNGSLPCCIVFPRAERTNPLQKTNGVILTEQLLSLTFSEPHAHSHSPLHTLCPDPPLPQGCIISVPRGEISLCA